MKNLLLIVIIFIIKQGFAQQKNKWQVQPFLPDLFSQFPNVRDITISALEDEIYFTIQSYQGELSAIAQVKKENNKWLSPSIVNFSGLYQDLEPFLSSDGLRLYFSSNRPLTNTTNKIKDYDIWYVSRTNKNDKWSLPVNMGSPINTISNEFYPSLAKNGNLYFTVDTPDSKGKDDIFMSKYRNGKYEPPFSLSDSINTEGYEFNAFISPDEQYIVYTGYNRKEGLGSGDLYISYNKGNNEWTKARNLGQEINSPYMDYCPFIKDNTLYFTGKRNTINKDFEKAQNIVEFKKEMNKYENGLSRIYKVENINFSTK